MIGGILYAVVAYVARGNSTFGAVTVGSAVAMCLVAAVSVPLARVGLSVPFQVQTTGSVPVIVVGTGKLAQQGGQPPVWSF